MSEKDKELGYYIQICTFTGTETNIHQKPNNMNTEQKIALIYKAIDAIIDVKEDIPESESDRSLWSAVDTLRTLIWNLEEDEKERALWPSLKRTAIESS